MQTKHPNAVKFEQWLDKQIIYHFALDNLPRKFNLYHVISPITETTQKGNNSRDSNKYEVAYEHPLLSITISTDKD